MTFVPITAPIFTVDALIFVTVPVLFKEVVFIFIPLLRGPILFNVKFPVPVIPPETCNPLLKVVLVFTSVVPLLFTVSGLVDMSKPVVWALRVVTLLPTPPLILAAVRFELEPALEIVPTILIGKVETTTILVLTGAKVRSPVPVIPPVNVFVSAPVEARVKLLFIVIAPLKVLAAVQVIVDVPVLPEAIVIG